MPLWMRFAFHISILALVLAAFVPHTHSTVPASSRIQDTATASGSAVPCPACLHQFTSTSPALSAFSLAADVDGRLLACPVPAGVRAGTDGLPCLIRGPPSLV
jgi:hypothetical protein